MEDRTYGGIQGYNERYLKTYTANTTYGCIQGNALKVNLLNQQ